MQPTNQPAPVPSRWVSIRLHFGLRTAQGAPIPRSALRDALAEVSETWESYTRTNARGHWKGASEPSLVFERIALDSEAERSTARSLARYLASVTFQECVALSVSVLDSFELESPGSSAPSAAEREREQAQAYNQRTEALATSALDSLADELTDIRCALRDRAEHPSMIAHAESVVYAAEDRLKRARLAAESPEQRRARKAQASAQG